MFFKIFLVIGAFVFTCGNPEIQYYLINYSQKNSKKNQFLLSENPQIYLEVPALEEIDYLSESLNIAVEGKYYRLPPIQILKVSVENNMSEKKILYFADCLFQEESGKLYSVISFENYQKRFTSQSYHRFPYNSIYAFYFTKHPEKNKKQFGPYLDRILPGQEIELVPKSAGFQYLPFELFPAYEAEFRFFCEKMGLETKFSYRIRRGDKSKEF